MNKSRRKKKERYSMKKKKNVTSWAIAILLGLALVAFTAFAENHEQPMKKGEAKMCRQSAEKAGQAPCGASLKKGDSCTSATKEKGRLKGSCPNAEKACGAAEAKAECKSGEKGKCSAECKEKAAAACKEKCGDECKGLCKTEGKKACGSACKGKAESEKSPIAVQGSQKNCPVMGGAINKNIFVDHNGQRIYLCCEACVEPFKKNPDLYLEKLEKSGENPDILTPAPEQK